MSEHDDPGTEHRSTLGGTVRSLRHARSLTLRDLAGLIGVSPATLSGIENGNTGVSSERVAHIADALGVPVERLFAESAVVAAPPPLFAATTTWVDGSWRHFPPLVLDAALGGALSSFLEFGYHGANMRTIAERAALSVPGLYHYYPGKQDMLVALLDLTMLDLRGRTEAARAEGSDPVERFTNIVECLALFHTHRRELAFVGASEMRSLTSEARTRVAAQRIDEQRMVDLEVEEGVRAGVFGTTRPHEASRAVVTMCTALAQWFRRDGPATAETVASQYVDFALALVRYDPPA
jgi:AcrR family transcriptional regulator/DNA-binding XRE family transcriptional regulator